MTETEACIALNMVPGMGPVRLRALLETFEIPQRILAAGKAALRAVKGVGQETADAIASWESHVDLAAELKRIADFGARVITASSPEYPAPLRTIHNPPVVLYVWGEVRATDAHAIGIVGSRNVTHYGTETAKKLSFQLAFAGYAIVSGLARGIDTSAHQGALAAKGRTIAVIGSGLAQLYPPENRGLAEKIAESGAVVSEYPMERPADRQTFPYRNRIVAGWGRGLLVVEAGLNSGALITANQAVEQGRTVFAIPGQIDRPTSAGTNRLIQQGARLVTSADDILDELGTLIPRSATASSPEKSAHTASADPSSAPPLSHDETLLVTALEVGELTLDELSAATRLPLSKISGTLLGLEMKRLIRALPGHRYARI
ncbi:MAG: DNA-processing protein DprA [Chthoniobacteraceae bacterium]